MSAQAMSTTASRMPRATFFPLSKEDIFATWPLISEYLSTQKGGILDQWDIGSLFTEIFNNPNMHLWIAHSGDYVEGLMLVSFSNTPRQRLLWITAVHCNNVRKYLHLHKNLEQWAAMCGAEAVLFDGAHPWKRMLKKIGYSTPTALLRKDVRTLWSN